MVRCAVGILTAALILSATTAEYASVKRKFSQIDKGQVKPGSSVTIGDRELNAYVVNELPQVAPPGVRAPKVALGQGWAEGRAIVDFLKVRRATGAPEPNWLVRKLLEGEREVEVRTRIQSGSGQARVDVERVEIGGIAVSGGALDYIIRHYVMPRYPQAKIGTPFELGHGIDRLDVRPGEVRIVMAARR